VGEVIPLLVAQDSPFLRPARTQADENPDGFRNVANMTASSLTQPGTHRVQPRESGPQMIPASAMVLPSFQYGVKLAGGKGAVEWWIRVYMLGGVVRAGGGATTTGGGAIIEAEYCPFDELPSTTTSSPIPTSFLASLMAPLTATSEMPMLKDVTVTPATLAGVLSGVEAVEEAVRRRKGVVAVFKAMREESLV